MSAAASSSVTPAVLKVRTWMTRLGFAAVGIVFLSVVTYQLATYKSDPKTVSAQQQAEKEMVLSMPAKGASVSVSPPTGYAVTITSGTGYTLHYVYADGREGTVGDPTSPQGDGHIVAVYVRDTTGRKNSVTYAFVRPNRTIRF